MRRSLAHWSGERHVDLVLAPVGVGVVEPLGHPAHAGFPARRGFEDRLTAQPDAAVPDEPAPAQDGNGIDAGPAETVQAESNGDARPEPQPESDVAPPPAEPAEAPAVQQASETAEPASDEAKSTGLSALRRRGWWQRRAD